MKKVWIALISIVPLVAVLSVVLPSSAAIPVPADSQVLFVGDSITAGIGTWNPATHAWPVRWTDRVCGLDTSCRSRIRVNAVSGRCLVASGCAGTTVDAGWSAEVLNLVPKPTTVVVEIGVNDLGTAGIYTLAAAYQRLVYSAADAGIRVILATIPPSTSTWSRHTVDNPLRQSINGWLRSYFGANAIFDLDALMRIGTSGEADPNYFSLPSGSDGLHPSSWGAVCMADWLDPARIA